MKNNYLRALKAVLQVMTVTTHTAVLRQGVRGAVHSGMSQSVGLTMTNGSSRLCVCMVPRARPGCASPPLLGRPSLSPPPRRPSFSGSLAASLAPLSCRPSNLIMAKLQFAQTNNLTHHDLPCPAAAITYHPNNFTHHDLPHLLEYPQAVLAFS